MRRRGELSTLRTAISEALKDLGLHKRYEQHRVWEVWDDVVGPRIASVAQPDALDFDNLFVAVEDSIWLQQLNYLQQHILDELNKALGREIIGRIYFRLGKPKRAFAKERGVHHRTSLPEPDVKEVEAIDHTTSALKDRDSRTLLRSILIKSAALMKQSNKDRRL